MTMRRCRSSVRYACCATAATQQRQLRGRRGARRMKFHCCDARRLEVLKRSGTRQRDRVPRGAATSPRRAGALRQQTLFVRLLRPGFALTPDNLRITGGERIADRRHRVGARRPMRCRRRPSPAWSTGVDDLPRTLVVRTDGSGDFSTLHARASSPTPGSDQPPAGFDPMLSAIEFSFKVECPSDFDCAHAAPCPPATAPSRPDIDYLAKDYHGLPAADARPAEPAGAGLDRALGRRSRRRAGRAAGLRRRQPVATARTRSPTRPISPPRASASRCAATRGWSTTSCTKAATRAPSCTSTSSASDVALPQARSC